MVFFSCMCTRADKCEVRESRNSSRALYLCNLCVSLSPALHPSGTSESQQTNVYGWVRYAGATRRLCPCSQNSLWLASIVHQCLYTVLSDQPWASALPRPEDSQRASRAVEGDGGTEDEEEEEKQHCVPCSPFSCLPICFPLFLPVSVG